LPEGKVPVHGLPEEFTLYVEAQGWQHLRQRFRTKPTVTVDISRASNPEMFVTNAHLEYFNEQLSPRYRVKSIQPRTITLKFDDVATRTLAPVLSHALEFKPPFELLGEIRLDPDSVVVSGPSSVLDTMTRMPTEVLSLKKVDAHQRGRIGFPEAHGLIIEPLEVSYEFDVAQFTESTVEVPIRILGTNQAATITPSVAKITFRVPLEKLDALKDSAVVRLWDVVVRLDAGTADGTAQLELLRYPEFVRHPTLLRQTVNYLLVTQ
jgi:hypothetical protein